MPKDDPHVLPEALPSASRRGRVAVLIFVVVLALLVAVGAVVSRSEEATSSPPHPVARRVAHPRPPQSRLLSKPKSRHDYVIS